MYMKTALTGLTVFIIACGSARSAVVWSDEFNDEAIDSGIWTYDVGGGGYGNGQLEHNTARSENSYIENGSLVLEARRESYSGNEFTSARMLTQGRFAFKYGTLEARIQLPDTADGLWPAFWMLGNNFPGIAWPNCGEIDILESGADAGIQNGTQNELINCAMHFSNAAGDYEYNAAWINASDVIGTDDLSADYHRYKVDWTPTELTFYLDDIQYATWDITDAHFAEYHQPHFPILNLAIGGWNYVKITDPNLITATFPAKMKVDWIRLSDNPSTEIFLGEDREETGNFGVFTETTPVNNALVYGDDSSSDWPYSDEAAVYPWADTMTFAEVSETPSEGVECWTLDVAEIGWCGMGVLIPNFRNMANYSDGFLHVDIKTTSTDLYEFGIESARGKQAWLPVGDETTEFGFARDGNWHTITIPLNRFGNTDFTTVNQIFMLLCTDSTGGTTFSLDNIWWEPSVPRSTPTAGSFGVYTETGANKDAGEFGLGVDGNFFVWADTLDPAAQDPYEGSESLSFQSAAGLNWFGAAFTPNVKYDLSAFDNPDGKLNFALKTSSAVTFQVGMKSGNQDGVGQKWITFEAGNDPYGFTRDGNWHLIEIPTSNLVADVDLSQMSQLFQILGTDGAISDIELDDIYYSGGLANETNVVSAVIQDGVGISWPSTDGSTYTVQWTHNLSSNAWNNMTPAVEGDWTTKTVFDPFGSDMSRAYRILENTVNMSSRERILNRMKTMRIDLMNITNRTAQILSSIPAALRPEQPVMPLVLAVGLAMAAVANAAILAYEPFDYPAGAINNGDLTTASGTPTATTGGGYVGTWFAGGAGTTIVGGLAYPGLQTGNNALQWSSSVSYQGENLASAILPSATASVYVSFLYNAPSYLAGKTGFALDNGAASNQGYYMGMTSSGVFGVAAGDAAAGGSLTTAAGAGTLDMAFNTTYFVVVRFDKDAGGTYYKSGSIWINPTPGGSEPSASGTFTGMYTAMNKIADFLALGSVVITDEIRLGTTWADVTPSNGLSGPGIPAGLQVDSFGDNTVSLSWTASTGDPISYNVKRAATSNGTYTVVGTTIAPTVLFTDILTGGATYYYAVTAVNAGGESADSSVVSATPTLGVPDAPMDLAATAGDNQVALSWTAPAIGNPTSYTILRSTTSGSGYVAITTPGAQTTTSYTDTTAVNGTTYYYVVTAENGSGASSNSTQVIALPAPYAGAYEPFDYPGEDNLLSGTASSAAGFGTWDNGVPGWILAGLSYPDLPVANHAMQSPAGRQSVSIDTPISSGTRWISYLWEHSGGDPGGNKNGVYFKKWRYGTLSWRRLSLFRHGRYLRSSFH